MTLIKLIVRQAVLSAMLFCLAACGGTNTSQSLGIITINGPGLSGSVPVGTGRIFTLQSISEGNSYTVHTEIPVLELSDGAIISDGTLTLSIYPSESAYDSGLPAEAIAIPSALQPNVYEANFTATSSGDYVAVIEGVSSSFPDEQFFYNLRLMSASSPYLTPLTPINTPPYVASANYTIFPDVLAVFNGGNVTTSGTYSITLISTSTITAYFPQLFVYKDPTLEVDSLLYSSITTSQNFIITDFTTTPPTTLPYNPNNYYASSGVTITGVPFTTGTTTGGPYIVLRGLNSPSNPYTLLISQ